MNVQKTRAPRRARAQSALPWERPIRPPFMLQQLLYRTLCRMLWRAMIGHERWRLAREMDEWEGER